MEELLPVKVNKEYKTDNRWMACRKSQKTLKGKSFARSETQIEGDHFPTFDREKLQGRDFYCPAAWRLSRSAQPQKQSSGEEAQNKDALNATRAAVEESIVSGGALLS